MVMLRDLAWQRLAPAPPPAPPGLAYVVKPLGTRRDVVGPVAEWLAAWASRTGLRFTELPLYAMPLAAQLAALQTTAVRRDLKFSRFSRFCRFSEVGFVGFVGLV